MVNKWTSPNVGALDSHVIDFLLLSPFTSKSLMFNSTFMAFLFLSSFFIALFSELNEEDLPIFIMVKSRTDSAIPGIFVGDEDGGGSSGSIVH